MKELIVVTLLILGVPVGNAIAYPYQGEENQYLNESNYRMNQLHMQQQIDRQQTQIRNIQNQQYLQPTRGLHQPLHQPLY